MKKYIFLLFIFVIWKNFAQKNSKGIVEYDNIINNSNGVSFASPYTLYFNKAITLYTKVGEVAEIGNEADQSAIGSDGSEIKVEKNIIKSSSPPPYYYTNTNTNELIFRESHVQKLYVIKDSIEIIPWKLHSDTKKIGEYNCQKATTQFRGRNYTAWFTTEIPVSHGPWKLRGLPGLIIEAYNESGKYEFRATTINLNPNIDDVYKKLIKPDITKIQGMQVYINALKSKHEDIMSSILARLPKGAKLLTDCEFCPKPEDRSIEIYK
ncbi:GLPGLI family protein [Aquimarina sp. W85]|uniref:GLPGLI family protein n=1 Tax=Aquimarina rhodophyticola TaxID=3342246 RepID=UPI00366D8355